MDWVEAIEQERQMLKRIVATLFSLARLCDHLCSLPRPVRGFVLWVLRRGEAAVRGFVLDTLDVCVEDLPATIFPRDAPADARRLAQSFRALARILNAEQRTMPRLGGARAGRFDASRQYHRFASNRIGRLAQALQNCLGVVPASPLSIGPAAPCPDTS